MTNTIVSLEVVNFKKEMERIEQEMFHLANADIKDLVKYGRDQLRRVTPVDTGEARRGWEYDMTLTPDERELLSAIIYNDVDYIDRLNAGHSKQAPKYFIEQTLMKIGIITPE